MKLMLSGIMITLISIFLLIVYTMGSGSDIMAIGLLVIGIIVFTVGLFSKK